MTDEEERWKRRELHDSGEESVGKSSKAWLDRERFFIIPYTFDYIHLMFIIRSVLFGFLG